MGNGDKLDTRRQDAGEEGQVQEAKTFTQEEVDEIVSKRLARERRKTGQEGTEGSEDGREQSLADRELRVMAKEKLIDMGLPTDLADVLRYSDEKTLETAVETIKRLNQGAPKAWAARIGGSSGKVRDPYRDAMGLK